MYKGTPEFKIRKQRTVKAIDALKEETGIKTRSGVVDFLINQYPRFKEFEKVTKDKRNQREIEVENDRLRKDIADLKKAIKEKEAAEKKIKEICDRIGLS